MSEIEIDRIGSEGDGMGLLQGRPVFVSGTLPGERVLAQGDGPGLELVEILTRSPERQVPPCPHFGECGGCVLQHASQQQILDWKRSEVALAFSKYKLNPVIEPTVAIPLSSRRRVTFTVKRIDANVQLGFKKRNSTEFIAIEQCPILLPELETEVSNLIELSKTLLRGSEEIQVAVNVCDNGFDLDFALETEPSETMTAAFVRAMAKTKYLRASFNGEVAIEKSKPMVRFGKADVNVPPGGFLQAVTAAENAMADLVCKHLGGRKNVVDLFCGSGTFALRLAERSKIHAVEMEKAALNALREASGTEGLKSITVEQRDLFELPLTASELKPYDGLCLDPPRAGASEQISEIAKSNIRAIAYVSCNPMTLARDCASLVKAGYELKSVTPIDQFQYSSHIEAVTLLTKKADKKARSIFR